MKDKTFESCLGMAISAVALAIVATLADGWALSKVWNWFMPSIFDLTTLTLWQAVGVSMVMALFTRSRYQSDKDTSNKSYGEVLIEQSVLAILKPAFVVGMAWIVWQMAF